MEGAQPCQHKLLIYQYKRDFEYKTCQIDSIFLQIWRTMSVAECESKAVIADTKNLDSKHRDIHTIYYLLINSAVNILLSHPSKQTP